MTKFLKLQLALCISLACVAKAANDDPYAPRVILNPTATRVLMIGDSMSVGTFGDVIQKYLLSRYGGHNVAFFASCGSSPEHWLKSEPDFVTRCGYREQSPDRSVLLDFIDRKPPPRVPTPKVEDLIARYRPTTVIVQLGTNWMDGITLHANGNDDKYRSILDRFIAALHGPPGTVRQIIWIAPPDSSHFPEETKRTVDRLIKSAAGKYSFGIILSSSMTHYTRGKSGGDGVHYHKEQATEWADLVIRELNRKLR